MNEAGRRLTRRQYEVLAYVVHDWTYAQVAYELGISLTTVQAHIKGALRRLDAPTRLSAFTLLGWTRLPPLPPRTCAQGHPRTKANTYIRPRGWIACRVCERERQRRRRRRTANLEIRGIAA